MGVTLGPAIRSCFKQWEIDHIEEVSLLKPVLDKTVRGGGGGRLADRATASVRGDFEWWVSFHKASSYITFVFSVQWPAHEKWLGS